MTELSERTKLLTDVLFPDKETRNTVERLLINECGTNVPFCENSTPEEMERIRFSVLKLGQGDIEKCRKAVQLANIDWRDLFMSAEFGHDIDAHKQWYEEIIEG